MDVGAWAVAEGGEFALGGFSAFFHLAVVVAGHVPSRHHAVPLPLRLHPRLVFAFEKVGGMSGAQLVRVAASAVRIVRVTTKRSNNLRLIVVRWRPAFGLNLPAAFRSDERNRILPYLSRMRPRSCA
mgnify:CR=1 FL=1